MFEVETGAAAGAGAAAGCCADTGAAGMTNTPPNAQITASMRDTDTQGMGTLQTNLTPNRAAAGHNRRQKWPGKAVGKTTFKTAFGGRMIAEGAPNTKPRYFMARIWRH
jgi:hypothetical protein